MPRINYKHSEKTKKKISLSNTGEKSSQWKGDDIKYQAIHSWLRSRFGKANKCKNPKCNKKSKNYQWCLKKGKKYQRKRECFIMQCKSCHKKYDFKKSTGQKISIAQKGKFSSNNKSTIFMWLRKEYGKANKCENTNCDKKSNNYVWTLKVGEQHNHNRDDYIMLCKKCSIRKNENKYQRTTKKRKIY